MKNLALISLFLLMSAHVNAQWWGSKKIKGNGNVISVNRDVGPYDVIHVGGPFDVILDSGTEGIIELNAEDNLLEHIETRVSGKTLKIRIKDGVKLTSSMAMKITIPFKTLKEVTLSGSGNIIGRIPIKAKSFETSVSGSGDLDLDIEAKEIEAKLSGSGNLSLRGTVKSVRYEVNGSGDLNARRLNAKNVDARTAGSGNIYLQCEGGTLKARAVGSGSIRYTGNPKKKDFKILGSGKISN